MAASEIVEESEATEPLFKQYKANEVLEIKKPRLHKLLEKQPMSMGAFQTICGITIFGLGIVTATSEEVTLGILLRVPILTGILFFFSGLLSFLLYKFPAFLHVSYVVNVGSFLVAGIGVILLSVDIYFWNSRKVEPCGKYPYYWNSWDRPLSCNYKGVMRVQAIILGVTLAEMMVTAVLLYLLHVERNREKDSGLQ
ncbi:uncharacterized protein si:ch211-269k10.4 isoform X1 [Brienomyrus brachyistius]|uniref:uncharacterized protein si:ch211-269k10.4 isoform X1 n=1 Tax=Brienomyrus brachyistius TaxID=42636 RepID=UPI0020B1B94E|nr:uncharacterized protein si:ch211-269k10.4 isoform X1 [Brienomyrus brachyistius]XP_048881378.1 uncharacterized protein si:ch211-269k10.4 isoform X1 [Brienomyrus brachyistius]